MKHFLWVFLLVSISACSTIYTARDPSSYSQEKFDSDYTDCEVKVNQAGYTDGVRVNFMKRCMSGRGWDHRTKWFWQ